MQYTRIVDEQELARSLSQSGTAVLCGGTDLLVRMRNGLEAPEHVLDISDLSSLRGIGESEGWIAIGAATIQSELLASPLIRRRLPLLAAALHVLGSVQIRNRGTLGGNLVNASPAADSAVPLLAYDAEVLLASSTGKRHLTVDRFLLGPSQTALEPGEYVRAIRIPVPEAGQRVFYHKVGKRRALTIAIASVGIVALLNKDRVTDIRIAAGSVAPTPLRLRSVEHAIIGQALDETTVAKTGRLAAEAVSPIDDVRATADYRRAVIGDLVIRALQAFLTR